MNKFPAPLHRMSLSILYFLGVMALSSQLLAQPMMMSADERAKRLKEQLSLDDKQTEKVKKLFEEGQNEAHKMVESGEIDRESMRESMMKMVAAQDKKIETLLTADQRKKYEEVKKERMNRMGGRRGNNERKNNK